MSVALTCFLAFASANTVRAQPAPYEINAIFSLTGTAAALGADEQTSLQVLEKAVNDSGGVRGRQIKFVIQDDQSNPVIALQLATALVAKHVPVILGPVLGATCRSVMPLINSSRTVLYCLSPNVAPTADGYLYSIGMSAPDIDAAMLRFLQGQGVRRVALIATTDASGQEGVADTNALFREPRFAGIQLVGTEYLSPTDLNATAQLARLKSLNPDAVFSYTPGTAFGTVLHGIHDLGWDPPVITTAANLSTARTKQYASFLPTNLYVQGYACVPGVEGSASAKKARQLYLDSLQKSNLAPEPGYCFAWDPGMIVVDALRQIGLSMTSDQLRDYIESLQAWGGAMGTYNFRAASHRGLSEGDVIVLRWNAQREDFDVASALGGVPLSKPPR